MGSDQRAARRRRTRLGSGPFDWMFASGAAVAVFGLALIVGLTVLAVRLGSGGGVADRPATDGAVVATEFRYSPARLESGPEVEQVLRNEGAVYHDLVISGVEDLHLKALPGEEDRAAVTLQPGRYVFWCTIPGHRDAGMVGELVVG